jgi:hypothetical protein
MGKAPTWTTKERETVALAWLRATNNGIQGADQKGEDFRNKIHVLFKALSPRDAPPGRFGDRPPKAIYVFLRDQVFPDINKFNESLRLIQASHPTGCNEDNILSMAIALHVGEAKRMDYNFRSFEHTKWANYSAWKILSIAPKFRPPSATMTDSPGSTTVDPTNHPVPLLVSLSNNSSPVDTVLSTPIVATNPAIASAVAAPPDSISTQALLNQTRDVQNEIMLNQMKRQYPLGAKDLSLSDLDPSNGGRGASMGNKKAKRELHRQNYESEKLKHLDRIERNIERQTKQNGEAQQVFKWHKIMKLAKMLQNDRLVKKVEKEIEKMLLLSSKDDEVFDDEAPDDEPETSTMNYGGADDDDNDSIPPCPLQI